MLKPMKRKIPAIVTLVLAGCLFGAINSAATVRYVNVNSTNPTPPYTNWVTAATNIQDAVSIAPAGDTIIVTNGVYPGGLNVTNPLALRSVNGPQFTVINGGGTNRCATLTEGSSLSGLTLTNGYSYRGQGGGVWCASTNAFLTNCVITRNRATYGGGAYRVVLHNCTLSGNSAAGYTFVFGGKRYYVSGVGGGAYLCLLHNCTLISNSASYYQPSAGGAGGSTLYNCIVRSNTARSGVLTSEANYDPSSVLNYCCTTPMPINGVGNITNAPLFVDYGNGDFHLQTNSPGINAGNNDYVTATTDLDGNPRIAGGTVDMGAYEFQPCITGGQLCSAICSPLTGFSFTFSGGTVGQPYRIQTSSSPAAGNWSDLTNFTYTGPIVITDQSAVSGPKKFYRAVSP